MTETIPFGYTGGLEPLDIVPKVKVLDEEGRTVLRGWYAHHVKKCVCFSEDVDPDDYGHCVVYTQFADWNMEQPMKVCRVTPPHRIVPEWYEEHPSPENVAEALRDLRDHLSHAWYMAEMCDGLPGVGSIVNAALDTLDLALETIGETREAF